MHTTHTITTTVISITITKRSPRTCMIPHDTYVHDTTMHGIRYAHPLTMYGLRYMIPSPLIA